METVKYLRVQQILISDTFKPTYSNRLKKGILFQGNGPDSLF